MSKKEATNLSNPSVLSFERKLATSDGLLFAGLWAENGDPDKWIPIKVQEKSIRGTTSNRMKTHGKDPAKIDAEATKPNLQRVDIAALPFDKDTLKICFSLRVLGSLSHPSACNNQDYQVKLKEKIDQYHQEDKFHTLAARYAENLANGRFLWRNRIGAESIMVRITHGEKSWEFSSEDFDLRDFNSPSPKPSGFNEVTEIIRQGLASEAFVFLTVEGFSKLGAGQEVFPSQELVLDDKKEKSKILYKIHENDQAAMHSQKIGNALRTIDTWHEDADQLGPIPVEPYGSVTSRGKAYRSGKNSFYKLLDNWILKDQSLELEEQHYVIANLIRGGVFSE